MSHLPHRPNAIDLCADCLGLDVECPTRLRRALDAAIQERDRFKKALTNLCFDVLDAPDADAVRRVVERAREQALGERYHPLRPEAA